MVNDTDTINTSTNTSPLPSSPPNPSNLPSRIYIDPSDNTSLVSQLRHLQSISAHPLDCLKVKGVHRLISLITGIDRSHISRVLRRYSGAKLNTLNKISSCLNVPISVLESHIQSQPLPRYKPDCTTLDIDVEAIRNSKESSRALGSKFGISRQTICNIRNTR